MKKAKSPTLAALLQDCATLERQFNVSDRAKDFGKLLTFEPNLNKPVHRWYKFKEGFSEDLVVKLLDEYRPSSTQSVSFLDPFSGVGTSLLAAGTALTKMGVKNIRVRGVEINPYMHFVGRTKLEWRRYDPVFLNRAASASMNGMRLKTKPRIPELSTINNNRYIAPNDLRRILELREKIRIAADGRAEARPLLLGIAAGAERVFNLRKDGRALRFSPRNTDTTVDEEIWAAWNVIAEDLQSDIAADNVDFRLVRGDGRRADTIFKGQRFDYVLFSPPYLNNIDYTEVYKIEQWLLGFLKTSAEMVAQRRRTFRSHPSCIFPKFADASTDMVVQTLGKPFERLLDFAAKEEKWRRRLFTGYFADMLRTLQSCYKLLKPGGRVFLIVGNSVHGTPESPLPVAADLWISKLAEAANLEVNEILVGRLFPRRRMEWDGFRESIIVMSKGKGCRR